MVAKPQLPVIYDPDDEEFDNNSNYSVEVAAWGRRDRKGDKFVNGFHIRDSAFKAPSAEEWYKFPTTPDLELISVRMIQKEDRCRALEVPPPERPLVHYVHPMMYEKRGAHYRANMIYDACWTQNG